MVDADKSQNIVWIAGSSGGSPTTGIFINARPGTENFLPMDKSKYRLHFINGFGSIDPIAIHINSISLLGSDAGLGFGSSLLFDVPVSGARWRSRLFVKLMLLPILTNLVHFIRSMADSNGGCWESCGLVCIYCCVFYFHRSSHDSAHERDHVPTELL